VVEAARPQERRIKPADDVSGADQHVVRGVTQPRDLAQELCGDTRRDLAFLLARGGNLLDFVHERHRRRRLQQSVEGARQLV